MRGRRFLVETQRKEGRKERCCNVKLKWLDTGKHTILFCGDSVILPFTKALFYQF